MVAIELILDAVDAMIAATALVHRRIIVTRNIKDFQLFGVEMLDPYVATDRP